MERTGFESPSSSASFTQQQYPHHFQQNFQLQAHQNRSKLSISNKFLRLARKLLLFLFLVCAFTCVTLYAFVSAGCCTLLTLSDGTTTFLENQRTAGHVLNADPMFVLSSKLRRNLPGNKVSRYGVDTAPASQGRTRARFQNGDRKGKSTSVSSASAGVVLSKTSFRFATAPQTVKRPRSGPMALAVTGRGTKGGRRELKRRGVKGRNRGSTSMSAVAVQKRSNHDTHKNKNNNNTFNSNSNNNSNNNNNNKDPSFPTWRGPWSISVSDQGKKVIYQSNTNNNNNNNNNNIINIKKGAKEEYTTKRHDYKITAENDDEMYDTEEYDSEDYSTLNGDRYNNNNNNNRNNTNNNNSNSNRNNKNNFGYREFSKNGENSNNRENNYNNNDRRPLHIQRIRQNATKRLPQAIIIGVKKCGTRALLEYLRLHPDMKGTGPEPHFFDRHYSKGLEWYRRKMPPTIEGQMTIEKTPSYFITKEVPQRIFNMSKDMKILVIVRDPVTRAISDYAQLATKRMNQMDRFEDLAFLNTSTRIVDTNWNVIRIGVYAKFLERWLHYFPLSQMHFVSGEQLISDPARELSRVQDFLGLKRIISEKHFYFNETKGFPCVKKAEGSGHPHCLGKTKGRPHPTVDPTVLKRLRDFYRPFNVKFYQMVHRNFRWP